MQHQSDRSGRPRHNFTAEQLNRARSIRADGGSWTLIGESLRCHPDTIRGRLDPEFAHRKVQRYSGPKSFIRAGESSVSPADAARALAAIPADTRNVLARFMGDPLPGRSALDRRRGSSQ